MFCFWYSGESTLLIARQVPCTATLISGPLLKRINIGKGGIVLRLFFLYLELHRTCEDSAAPFLLSASQAAG